MKNILYLFGLITFFACNSFSKIDIPPLEKTQSNESDSAKQSLIEYDLDGTWGLTNYFDTIIEHKSIAKYRIQEPTWFAITLEISDDSLKYFGSIDHGTHIIDKSSNTLTTITPDISDEWILSSKYPNLILTKHPDTKYIDSTNYIFRKRDDLSKFLKHSKSRYDFGNSITDYFNEQLFEGKYINQETNKEVVFGKRRHLLGIQGFSSFEVRNYFGTLHPHKDLDVVTFRDKENNNYKQYNWVFSEDELLLTEFIREKVTRNGKTYDGDYLVLGTEKIRFKKIK